MDTELINDISPDLIYPWNQIDVQYPDFQIAMWQNNETAEVLAVEIEAGPYGDQMAYDVLLLPADYEDNFEVLDRIHEGLPTVSDAIREAEALMVTNSVRNNL